MAKIEKDAWWDQLPVHVGGDMIVGQVGAGARGVAIGKNISQVVYDTLGPPTPDDKQIIEQSISEVKNALEGLHAHLEAAIATVTPFQMQLLEGELTKTGDDETPSANIIVQIGNWLLDNVPGIAEALTGLFATPAVGRVVGKAGGLAVTWLKDRFGTAPHAT